MRTGIRRAYTSLSAGILVALALGAVLTTAPGRTEAAQAAARVKASGTIKFSDWQFPDTLNPYQSTMAVSAEVTNAMFDGLFIYNNKAKLAPVMARDVPSVKNGGITNNGKTFTVHLKKGMRWSNGAEITAADIKFSWKIDMDPATGPYCSGSCDAISRIDTPDKYTAVFHFKKTYAPALPYAINGFNLWPRVWSGAWNNDAHAAALKLGQDASFNFEGPNYPTNGAYQVTQFNKDNRIVLQPMKYYNTMSAGAYVKTLIFAFYSNKAGMMAGAANGETDVTQNYTAADLPQLKQHLDAYKLYVDPGFTFEHLEFNVDPQYAGKSNPLANQKVRLALALAIDKVGLIRNALNVSAKEAKNVTAWTPLVNTPRLVQPFAAKNINGQWNPLTKKYLTATGTGSALQAARKLLSQTPYKDGFSIEVTTTTGNPVRQAQVGVLTANWARLGVKVTPNYVPATTLFSGWKLGGPLNHGQFQVAMFAFLGSPDPDQLKYNVQSKFIDREASVHNDIFANYSGFHNTIVDRAMNQAAATLTGSQRAKYYEQAQAEMNKQAYWIPLYFKPAIATQSPHVLNFSNNPTQRGPTWNIYAWKVKAKS